MIPVTSSPKEKDESCDNNHSKQIIVRKIIHSYTILAPQREGKFVDAKQSTAAVLTTIQLDENDYRLGHTKARKIPIQHFAQIHSPSLKKRSKFPILCKKVLFYSQLPNIPKTYCNIPKTPAKTCLKSSRQIPEPACS